MSHPLVAAPFRIPGLEVGSFERDSALNSRLETLREILRELREALKEERKNLRQEIEETLIFVGKNFSGGEGRPPVQGSLINPYYLFTQNMYINIFFSLNFITLLITRLLLYDYDYD